MTEADEHFYVDDTAAPATLRKYLGWYFFVREPDEPYERDDCDDYIDDEAAPAALRKYLAFARAPAHGQLLPRPHPRLFADYEGSRVRVTMASCLGDVGITSCLDAELGYDRRVLVRELSNFSEDP